MVSSNHTPNSGGQPVLTKEDAIQILQRLHTELDTPLFQFIGTEQQAVATLVWAFLALVVLLVVVILIMRALFELRRYVRDMPEVMEE